MQYENPEIPDGINTSERSPLRDFVTLLLAIAALSALLAGALALTAGYVARHVPFSTELKLVEPYLSSAPPDSPVRRYLQQVADRLIQKPRLPPGMSVRIHYSAEPTVNAFATLGGNIVVYRGLFEKLQSENEVAMLLGHEIAHVRHRDPIVSLGRGLAIGAVLATVSSSAGDSIAGGVMSDAGLLTQLTFSRTQEENADEFAMAALVALYGHAGGSVDLFQTLRKQEGKVGEAIPLVLRTHPHVGERIVRLQSIAARRGWQMSEDRQPIPPAVLQAIRTALKPEQQ